MLGFMTSGVGLQMAISLLELTKKEGLQPGDPRWDGTPTTHCNEYVYEAAEMLGFNCDPLLNLKGIGFTGASDMYRNGRLHAVRRQLKEHDGRSAQRAANAGRFVTVLAFNLRDGASHIAVVTQSTSFFDPRKGPKIVQAGAKNGEFYLNEIFRVPELSTPMFLELPKKKEGGNVK